MYYAEKMEDGRMWFKAHPDSEWREFTKEMYYRKIVELIESRDSLIKELNK